VSGTPASGNYFGDPEAPATRKDSSEDATDELLHCDSRRREDRSRIYCAQSHELYGLVSPYSGIQAGFGGGALLVRQLHDRTMQ